MSFDWLREKGVLDRDPPVLPDKDSMKREGIPERYWFHDLKSLQNYAHGAKVLAFVQNLRQHHAKGEGALLYGSRGTGKTAVACMFQRGVMARASTGLTRTLFVGATQCAHYYKNKDEVDGEGRRYYDRMMWNSWLVIDDLGSEHPQWDAQAMEQVVKQARYAAKRSTVLTTNLDLMALTTRYPWLPDLIAERTFELIEVPDGEHGGRSWRTEGLLGKR